MGRRRVIECNTKSNISTNFAKILKDTRLAKHLSLEGLSKLSDISTASICNYEAGVSEINISRLAKIAQALDISLPAVLEVMLNRNSSDERNIANELYMKRLSEALLRMPTEATKEYAVQNFEKWITV